MKKAALNYEGKKGGKTLNNQDRLIYHLVISDRLIGRVLSMLSMS